MHHDQSAGPAHRLEDGRQVQWRETARVDDLEIALGIGLLPARTRRWAALGLIALLAAVFPANVDMAINKVEVKPVDGSMTRSVGTVTGPQNWIRLPMQVPLAWWLWREARAAA